MHCNYNQMYNQFQQFLTPFWLVSIARQQKYGVRPNNPYLLYWILGKIFTKTTKIPRKIFLLSFNHFNSQSMKNFIKNALLLCCMALAANAGAQSEFNGTWGGNNGKAVITVTGNAVAVDMSKGNRPNATGKVIDAKTITVTHPDDKTYTGVLVNKDQIDWGNDNIWTRTSTIQMWIKGSGLGKEITYSSSGGNGAIWVVGLDNTIWRSKDSGKNWAQVGNGKALDIIVRNANIYIVGLDGFIWTLKGESEWVMYNATKKMKRLSVSASNGVVWAIGEDDILYSLANGVWVAGKNADKAKDLTAHQDLCFFINMEGKLCQVAKGGKSDASVVNATVNLKKIYRNIGGEPVIVATSTAGDEILISTNEGKDFTSALDAAKNGKALDVSCSNNTIHVIGIDNTHWYYIYK